MELTASFGYWLRRRRRALDLTQAALAHQVGCATVTIRKLEADQFRPSVPMAERLADCLALEPGERRPFILAARAELSAARLTMPVRPARLALNQGVPQHSITPPVSERGEPDTPSAAEVLVARMLQVERADERVYLWTQYDEVASGGISRLILLEGEPGVGKSRLVRELGSYARQRGAVFLEGRYRREGSDPYTPWIDALQSGLRRLEGDAVATPLKPQHEEVFPGFPERQPDRSVPVQMDSDEGIRRRLTVLAAQHPLVVFLDDLHWAPGLSVLASIVRKLERTPVLLVGAYQETELYRQPKLAADWADLYQGRQFTLLPLQPLTEEQCRHGLQQAFGPGGAAELGPVLYRHSRGFPFLMAEFLSSLVTRKSVRPGVERWDVMGSVDLIVNEEVGPMRAANGPSEEGEPGTVRQGPSAPGTAWANPFFAGPPIEEPRHFFGRERELRRLFGLWQRLPLQNAALIGPSRSGKTSLLRYLRAVTTTPPEQLRPGQRGDWLAEPERYRWVFVDFQDPRLRNQEGLLRYLLTGLRLTVPSTCGMSQFMEIVSRGLRHPTIILLDNISGALEHDRDGTLDTMFWEGLRSLATNHVGGKLGFALVSHEPPHQLAQARSLSSPFFNIFGYTTTLGPLTGPEARALIASSPAPALPEDVEWILENSQRWPILLQILCREYLVALENQETDSSWKDEGLRQMAPFRHLLAPTSAENDVRTTPGEPVR